MRYVSSFYINCFRKNEWCRHDFYPRFKLNLRGTEGVLCMMTLIEGGCESASCGLKMQTYMIPLRRFYMKDFHYTFIIPCSAKMGPKRYGP